MLRNGLARWARVIEELGPCNTEELPSSSRAAAAPSARRAGWRRARCHRRGRSADGALDACIKGLSPSKLVGSRLERADNPGTLPGV
jgi:hypothetical protein